MIRVAMYARVSKNDGTQTAENQLLELRQFVANKAREGWQLVIEYVDEATGKNSDRSALQRMFDDAAQRKFDLLLFWSIDRLSREGALQTMLHLKRLTDNGVDWWSYREEYLRSIGPFSVAVLSILATVAQMERVRISDRVKAGLARASAAGRKGGQPKRAFDRARAREMREAGVSYREIGAMLGVPHTTVQDACRTEEEMREIARKAKERRAAIIKPPAKRGRPKGRQKIGTDTVPHTTVRDACR